MNIASQRSAFSYATGEGNFCVLVKNVTLHQIPHKLKHYVLGCLDLVGFCITRFLHIAHLLSVRYLAGSMLNDMMEVSASTDKSGLQRYFSISLQIRRRNTTPSQTWWASHKS